MKKRKWLAALLAAVMIAVMMPGMAFAAGNNVAKVGDKEYSTLKAAITEAGNDSTIELLDNVKEDITLDKSVIIEGNGKTIDGTTILKNGTLKNVTLTLTSAPPDKQLLTIGSTSETNISMTNVTVKYPLVDLAVENKPTISHVLSGNQADITIDGCLFTNDANNGAVTVEAPQWSFGLSMGKQGEKGSFTFKNNEFNGAFRTMLPGINGTVTIEDNTFVNEVYSVQDGPTNGAGDEATCITTAKPTDDAVADNLIIRDNVINNAGAIYFQMIPAKISGNTIKYDVFEHYVQVSGSAGGHVDMTENTFSGGNNNLIIIDVAAAPVKLPAGQMAVTYWPWADTDASIKPADYSSYKYAYNEDGTRTFYPETEAALKAFVNPVPGNVGIDNNETIVISENMTINASTAVEIDKNITIEIPKGHTLTLEGDKNITVEGKIKFTGEGKLVVKEDATFNISQGAAVEIETAIENNGKIENNGDIAFIGPVTGDGEASGTGSEEVKHVDVVHVNAKDATCTEAGNVEYWYCNDCGKYFLTGDFSKETTKEAVIIDKIAHTYKDGKCAVCGTADPDNSAKTGDDFNAAVPLVLAVLAAAAIAAVVLARRKHN